MPLTDLAANVEADASRALLEGGYLRLYQVEPFLLLVELRFSAPAFRGAVGGVTDAYPLAQVAAAVATGTAGLYRAYRADGVTLVQYGTVGVSGEELVLDRAEVRAGAAVSVQRFTYRIPVGA